jgi:hypothetical protein
MLLSSTSHSRFCFSQARTWVLLHILPPLSQKLSFSEITPLRKYTLTRNHPSPKLSLSENTLLRNYRYPKSPLSEITPLRNYPSQKSSPLRKYASQKTRLAEITPLSLREYASQKLPLRIPTSTRLLNFVGFYLSFNFMGWFLVVPGL